MPSSIAQMVIGISIAPGMAAAGVGLIGSAVAHSTVERAQFVAPQGLAAGHASTLSDSGPRLSDRQQLRKLLLGN
jgi:hypothetical protein